LEWVISAIVVLVVLGLRWVAGSEPGAGSGVGDGLASLPEGFEDKILLNTREM
jgi:hypothetical protein